MRPLLALVLSVAIGQPAGRPRSMFIADANGANPRPLADIPAAEGTPEWPSWTSDGQRIAVQVGKYVRGAPSQNTAHIWIVDLNGGATRLAAHDRPYLDETPSWFKETLDIP